MKRGRQCGELAVDASLRSVRKCKYEFSGGAEAEHEQEIVP